MNIRFDANVVIIMAKKQAKKCHVESKMLPQHSFDCLKYTRGTGRINNK